MHTAIGAQKKHKKFAQISVYPKIKKLIITLAGHDTTKQYNNKLIKKLELHPVF